MQVFLDLQLNTTFLINFSLILTWILSSYKSPLVQFHLVHSLNCSDENIKTAFLRPDIPKFVLFMMFLIIFFHSILGQKKYQLVLFISGYIKHLK